MTLVNFSLEEQPRGSESIWIPASLTWETETISTMEGDFNDRNCQLGDV